jgi:DNA polymerase-1
MSSKDVITLFRDILQHPQKMVRGKKKNKGGYSVDKAFLTEVKNRYPVAKSLLRMRGVSKMLSSWIVPYLPGGEFVHADGRVHCSFTTTRVETRRTSCTDPNMQGFPKRSGVMIRSIFRAEPGCVLVAADQGQLEARVIAMHSKDKMLVDFVRDGKDIHMFWAQKMAAEYPPVLALHDGNIKKLRGVVKSFWVFAAFFGAGVNTLSDRLLIPVTLAKTWLAEFWKTHSGVKKWQESLLREYEETGCVRSLTGFATHGPMTVNQIYDRPIQTAGSDIVVAAMKRLADQAQVEKRPELQAILNIHDDLTFMVPEPIVDETIRTISREMVRKTHAWMNVPLAVEVAVGPDWGTMKEVGTFAVSDFEY